MRVIDLALKDLSQLLKDWKTTLFMVVMPIVFTMFFGFVFSSDGGTEDLRLPVGFASYDASGTLGGNLHNLVGLSKIIRPVVLEEDDVAQAGELVRDGKLAAAMIVPDGFSAGILAGEHPELTVIIDQNTQAGHMVNTAISAVLSRLLAAVQTAQLSAQTFEQTGGDLGSEATRQTYLDEALALASDGWRQPALTVTVEQVVEATEDENPAALNAFTQSSPGMIVMFAVFGLMGSATVLVLERQNGALKRMLTTPISKAEVIGGHLLGMFIVVFVQQSLLIVVGQLAFGVDYMREPLAILLVVATLSFWAASLGMLIGAIATTEEHVIAWSLLAMFIFAAMGGAWFPLDFVGPTFAAIGRVMPTAWAMEGFQNIVLRGLGLNSVMLPVGILLAFGIAFFGLAVWRFRFE